MQRFVSKAINKLDAKGRVSVPSLFRQVLAAQHSSGFFCIKALGHRALNGFGEPFFAEANEQLSGFNPVFSKDYAARATAIFAQACYLEIDGDGRVRLPDELVEYAGISDRVQFVGLDRIFEIWNPETFDAVERARIEEMQRAYELGSVT